MGLLDTLRATTARFFAAAAPRALFAAAQPMTSGAYDAARMSRRLSRWQPTNAHINTILSWSGATLRDRTRDLVRNNPYVRSAVDSFVANAVGCGIKPSSLVKDAGKKNEIRQTWSDWTDQADADGLTDFYGLEALACRAMVEAGECFIRFRPRRAEDNLVVPLQLQMLEPDQLPLDDNRALANGNVVKCGIEFDAIGRRVAYWFLRRHPGDLTDQRASFGNADLTRVPASEVLHVFKPWRPGQIRGEPQLIASLVRLYMLDQYEDAEIERKKIAAMFTSIVTQQTPEDKNAALDTDDDGTEREHIEPGTTAYLLPGEQITVPPAADVGPNFEAFIMRALLAACAGLGVPYANVTGDLRNANYSSMRAGTVEFRTRIEQFQHQTLVLQMGRPIWARWMDAAALAGALALPGYARDPAPWRRVKWISPRLPWVDPQKDINAEIAAVNAGFKSRSDVIESQGEDPEEVDARIAQDKAREKTLGLDFSVQAQQPAANNQQPATDMPDMEAVDEKPPARDRESSAA